MPVFPKDKDFGVGASEDKKLEYRQTCEWSFTWSYLISLES